MPAMTTTRCTGRRRSPKSLALAVLLGSAFAAVPSTGVAAPGGKATPLPEHRPVCIRDTCFDAEIAVTAFERGRGLMFRDSLAKDRGMLFVFPEEGQHLFWMKNTRIELDMIFIGADHQVVSISHRAKPCTAEPCDRYGPAGNSAYVLEIAGGLAATYGFAKGDRVEFRGLPAGK
jgi:uncharacterized membrane protein (UPF0127 family)